MALPRLSEAAFCLAWLREVGRKDPLFPVAEGRVEARWRTDTYLRIDERHRLILVEDPEIVLGQFVGADRRDLAFSQAALLLNGDGLRTQLAQAVQARLRQRAHRLPGIGLRRTLVLPYLALNASGVDFDSIWPIHVSGERETTEQVKLEPPPYLTQRALDSASARQDGWTSDRNTGTWHGEWQHRVWSFNMNSWNDHLRIAVMFQPRNGRSSWHSVTLSGKNALIHARVHHLGASVFSALDKTGKRHRFISAFDEQENEMYFLAQLPDGPKVTNYETALEALAPPIVQQARAEGRLIHRQGDVFAISTDLSNKEVSRDAVVTRRSSVLTVRGGGPPRFRAGIRKSQRDQIMIHGTGHTATVVARKMNGVTFVKGTMFHDPMLEEVGRTREHRNVSLGDKWFLCVRNSVPTS